MEVGSIKAESRNLPKAGVDMVVTFCQYGWGIRHVQMFCMFVCMTTLFIVRGSMAVAVLAMTDVHRNQTGITIYDWDKKTQGVVLSSFFWGYMVMQIPAGVLARRFGGKLILLVALVANGVLCLALPSLVQLGGWHMVCASRVAMGLTQACLFPASHTLLGRWLHSRERTTCAGIVYGGNMLGTIIAMPVSGLLAETAMGWKLIFYSMAVLMLVTAALWYGLSASTPREHPMISGEEIEYIEGEFNVTKGSDNNRIVSTPWRHILTSVPLWAIVSAHFSCCAGFILFFNDMPTYLERGLGISLKNSALLSALPYLGMWIGNTMSTISSQKVYNNKLLSIASCRKICNSIGLYGLALGLVVLSFLGPEQAYYAIATLIVALMLNGFCSAGFMVNHLDLSPTFAGLLLSITNFTANISSVITPILTAYILRNDPTDVSRWRIVFLLVAGVNVVCNTLYVIYGSSTRQAWDQPGFDQKPDPEEMTPVLNDTESKTAKEKEANP